jgi:hypothetical protein
MASRAPLSRSLCRQALKKPKNVMGAISRLGPALDAREPFRITRSALFELLSRFDAADWTSVTAAAPWTVHDVVAHLPGDDVLRLSRSRDWSAPELGFPASLHHANAQRVAAFQPASPQVLVYLHGKPRISDCRPPLPQASVSSLATSRPALAPSSTRPRTRKARRSTISGDRGGDSFPRGSRYCLVSACRQNGGSDARRDR